MSNWYWKARYGFYRVSGVVRRFLGLSFRNGKTLGEVMAKLEAQPEIRAALEDARKRLGIKTRHW